MSTYLLLSCSVVTLCSGNSPMIHRLLLLFAEDPAARLECPENCLQSAPMHQKGSSIIPWSCQETGSFCLAALTQVNKSTSGMFTKAISSSLLVWVHFSPGNHSGLIAT